MLILLKFIIIIVIVVFTSFAAQAKDVNITSIISSIEKKQSNPALRKQAIRLGKDRALLCNQCHGEDGNSTKPGVPNLAAQNPVYLLNQIEKFTDGRRKNFVINALSKNFSRDDKENLAIFYASMKVNPEKTNEKLAKKGQSLYIKQCSSCHGNQGAGKSNYARLAGQKTHYVEMTLRSFRDNQKNSGMQANRNSNLMELIAKELSNDDIKALAAYVAQLK